MFFIRHLRFYRQFTVSLGVLLLALLPMHSQAANADAPHNNQSTKPYKGRAVEQIYNTYCIACHMSGVAGAPRFGHAEDWQPHVDKGIEVLLEHVITGFKAMPPRGICSDCSDEELLHTIHYMIDQSQ